MPGTFALPAHLRLGRTPITAWFLGSAGLIGAVLLLLLMGGIWYSHKDAVERAEVQAASLAQLIAREAERTVDGATLMLDQLVTVARDTNWTDPAQTRAAVSNMLYLRSLLPSAYNLFITDDAGRVVATTLPMTAEAPTEVGDRPYFRRHADDGVDVFIGDPIIGRAISTALFTISRRVPTRSGGFGGVVVVTFQAHGVAEFYRTLSGPYDMIFLWMKDNGRTLVRYPSVTAEQMLTARLPDEVTEAVAGSPAGGRVEYRAADGTERLAVFRPVGPPGRYPLNVSVDLSLDAVGRRWFQQVWTVLAFAALVLVVLAGLVVYAVRWTRAEDAYRHQLADYARRLATANRELEGRVRSRTADLAQALDQKELLLKEMNHRVKNSLQLVASFLTLQMNATAESARQPFADAVSRVAAIARVHERLYRAENVEQLPALDYLRDVCADLADTARKAGTGDAIVVEGDAVTVTPDTAVQLGLVVNELVTNALKHGRRADPGPLVEVSLRRMAEGQLAIAVRDYGPGLAADALAQPRLSLGLRIIKAVTGQLKGRIDITPAEPGARVVVTLPI